MGRKNHPFEPTDEILRNERWLAGFETPNPPANTLAEIKRAIRRELQDQGDRKSGV